MIETALMALVFLITIVVVVAVERRRRIEFNDRFPPISDEEFLARCGPGTKPEVALKVRKIVAFQMGVDHERIYPTTRFVEDLGAD